MEILSIVMLIMFYIYLEGSNRKEGIVIEDFKSDSENIEEPLYQLKEQVVTGTF